MDGSDSRSAGATMSCLQVIEARTRTSINHFCALHIVAPDYSLNQRLNNICIKLSLTILFAVVVLSAAVPPNSSPALEQTMMTTLSSGNHRSTALWPKSSVPLVQYSLVSHFVSSMNHP